MAGALALGQGAGHSCAALAPVSPSVRAYSGIRGFNYQPSWGPNGYEIWTKFKPEIFDRELAQGKNLFPHINTVRLWLSLDAVINGNAADQKGAAANFSTALTIAGAHGLKVIPVLFNNWHSIPDFGGIAVEMVKYWTNPQDRNHTMPKNVFRSYLESIVGPHAAATQVLLWDLCNEPFNSGVNPSIQRWLEVIYQDCKNLGAKAPLAVGMAPDPDHLPLLNAVSDVITIHPYGNERFLDAAIAFADKSGKDILATECCWGSLDDMGRAKIIDGELNQLRKRGMGFLAHVLHHSLVADCHRPQYGPMSGAGYMAFIEADGTLRPHHDIFNKYA